MGSAAGSVVHAVTAAVEAPVKALAKPFTPKIDTSTAGYVNPAQQVMPDTAILGASQAAAQRAAATAGGTIFGDPGANRARVGNDPLAPRKSLLGQ